MAFYAFRLDRINVITPTNPITLMMMSLRSVS
jgi:hypothetical protein